MDRDDKKLALTCNLSNEYFIRQAKSRWLRPSEICEILRGHNRLNLTVDPPHKPPSGSLFLFDRKLLRYFRKDGHCWRKMKDGRTVREAHEKLKTGNVDALHCYYAHGEDNKDFQRRIYWLLDEKLENIVLVHYRDLGEEMVENSVYVSSLLGGQNMVDCSGHAYHIPYDHYLHRDTQINDGSVSQANILAMDHPLEYKTEVSLVPKSSLENETHPREHGELSKLDSSRGWMDKEIGKDCDDALMTSGSFWNYIVTESGDTELTSLSHHMHFDIDQVGPSLQEQLYSILDFSPDWAFSGDETKVLVTGRFLGNLNPANFKWCCMIGENEVPAELLPTNAIRCQAPVHAPGLVPFYITRNNRSACSEIREFEYREDLHGETFTTAPKSVQEDDIYLQLRYEKLISLRADRKMQICAVKNCLACNLKKNFSMLRDDVTEWDKIEMDYKNLQGSNWGPKDALVQHMLKGRLYEWLVYKTHEGRVLNVLDEGGQGVIHLAASLGYQWAMRPIVVAGVNPNFRDARGRTGLHWAALYGREETVIELVKLGASPGTVDDPTSNDPEGQTAADLAWARGHKGIAGYLAELDLTAHLSKLALEESVMDTLSATVAAEAADETLQKHMTGPFDGDEGDKSAPSRVLAAVRNSDIAARRIQAALKSESWHKRQLTRHNNQT